MHHFAPTSSDCRAQHLAKLESPNYFAMHENTHTPASQQRQTDRPTSDRSPRTRSTSATSKCSATSTPTSTSSSPPSRGSTTSPAPRSSTPSSASTSPTCAQAPNHYIGCPEHQHASPKRRSQDARLRARASAASTSSSTAASFRSAHSPDPEAKPPKSKRNHAFALHRSNSYYHEMIVDLGYHAPAALPRATTTQRCA